MREMSSGQTNAADVPAVDTTGVPGLDEVLGGGVPRGSLVLVVGPPGSGKTTIAAQIAFTAARSGRPTLVLTAFSEPTLKLLTHLRAYTFFDEALVGDVIQVLSLDQFLVRGLDATAEEVVAEVRRRHVGLIVLDGFSGVRAMAGGEQTARQFLYDLGTRLGAIGATTIITNESVPRDPLLFPEATSADVLIGVHYDLDGVREGRAIEAIKVRGAAPLPGLHGFRLSDDGARVYRRLEARVIGEAGDEAAPPAGRAAFDLPALDALLDGGLTRRTSTLVLGSPGSGKTLLGLQYAIAGMRAGERTVFLGFQETRGELLHKGEPFSIGPDLQRGLAPGGAITLLRQPPVERNADVMADDLLQAIEATGAQRVVIDSMSTLERAVAETSGDRRIPNYLGALTEALRTRNVTTLLIRELDLLTTTTLDLKSEWVSLLASNVIWLQQVTFRDRLHRVLSVPKMRYSAHDVTLREFTIAAPAGLQVLVPFESESGVLDGIARRQGQPIE